MKTKQTRFDINVGGKKQEIVLEVYERNDIVSDSIGGKVGWENEAANEYITIFKKYAKDHNLRLSDLTFVDIGANIGWFTIRMAAAGVNVIAFEPMEQNLHLIRTTLCHPESSSFSDRVVVFPTGLSETTQTCIFSGKDNVGDGVTTCVGDLSTFVPWKGYDIRGYIPVDRIDNILSPGAGRKIVVVKMDTEGSETNVLLGGPSLFLKSKIPYISLNLVPTI